MSPDFMLPDDAHALMQEALAWWRTITPAAGRLPGRQHIDPTAIPKLLPHLWLLDVHRTSGDEPTLRLRYRLVGSHVDLGFGTAKTGRWFDEVEPAFATDAIMQAPYIAAIDRHDLSYRRGKPRFGFNSGATSLERLLLPLATDGEAVDMLLGFTIFYDGEGTIIRTAL